jgi:hypothetical protein
MSFFRHGEIYHFDEGAIPADHALAHRNDEFPDGYSLAGCAPAEPAAASPSGAHLARKGFRGTMQFQRTVRSALTVCLTPGDNPTAIEVMEFLKDWLGKHILGSDKKYGPFLNAQGVR